jgi:tetratricopeptide (TPR) repeat protein
MSIDDELRELQTVTEGDRALQLFTDRYELTRLFAKYLNEESPRKTILFFHGDGGNGKSLLLKFLRQRCCKRFLPETWQKLQAIPKDEVAKVAAYIENAKSGEDCIPVPAVLLDFSQTPIGEDQPQHPFYGLLMLRRNLADAAGLPYRLRFPLYDFACVWYLHKKGKSAEEIKRLFPLSEITGLIVPFIDLATKNPLGSIGKAFFDIIGKDLGQQFTVYLHQRKLKKEQVEEIFRKNLDTELIDELPRLFAEDLNASIAQQDSFRRIVLFFDAHEAFWGHQRDLPEEVFFQRDEWLRCLLRALDLSAGIVVVVAGREKPRWAEANQSTRIPQQYLDTQFVGHFSAVDARDYLQKADIKDAALQQSLIDYASVAADEVHPLYLGLCADVVLAARAQGKVLTPDDFPTAPETPDKSRALINRLLKYVAKEVEVAVHALCACRAFDFELYLKLGQALHFHATRAAFFYILTRFSFVWQAQQRGENWYRIHDLLRRLDDESGNETTRHAHEVLEQHYRERGEVAEAIYHANRLDWERGVNEWVEVFNKALELSCYEQCRTLLDIRSELSIPSGFKLGNVSLGEGNYFAELAQYPEAEQEYLEAIKAYNQAHALDPDNFKVLNNKGDALFRLGNLQLNRLKYPEALQSYEEAIVACDQALCLNPKETFSLNNKGNALTKLGDLQVRLVNYSEALQRYKEAIDTYKEALECDPKNVSTLNNIGNALQRWGDLQANLTHNSEALQRYEEAIDTYNEALNYNPDNVSALNNKGATLKRMADLQERQSEYTQALHNYQEALDTYDKILSLAPSDVNAHNNQGLTLHSLGFLQARLGEEEKALESWTAAIEKFSGYLEIAPNDKQIRNVRDLLQQLLDNWGYGS